MTQSVVRRAGWRGGTRKKCCQGVNRIRTAGLVGRVCAFQDPSHRHGRTLTAGVAASRRILHSGKLNKATQPALRAPVAGTHRQTSSSSSASSTRPRRCPHRPDGEAGTCRAAWAPEFWRFPDWASGVDLLFAEAAGWIRPIRFAKGIGGHAAALDVSREARARGVRRLVLAHIGRPTIRALEKHQELPFGEAGQDGAVYELDCS